jgi:hypothetical protein
MENSPPEIQTIPLGAEAGAAALLAIVGPKSDLESEDDVAAGEGPGAVELGFALDEAAGGVVAPAATVSDDLRRNIHAHAIKSTIASGIIHARRALLPLDFSDGIG